jgi:hypothetical protein
MKLGKQLGLLYINGYDHPDILAGQGKSSWPFDLILFS